MIQLQSIYSTTGFHSRWDITGQPFVSVLFYRHKNWHWIGITPQTILCKNYTNTNSKKY